MMIPELKAAFDAEMAMARRTAQAGDPDAATVHLERAHVLGQYHVLAHAATHWWMLRLALRRGRLADAAGQALRLVLGTFGSAVGRVPRGNTGGSNVNMFMPMAVDPELADLVERDLAARR